ncbi:pyridoxamine 5'-phosphate oxidase family protein [uncultured Gordonia sp.]|uniref:pyridoxamine 5'-phosphate oxidase family protein n=1 Tax=uncultured Gordonia sp. TaxID=198437 RepID=UPI002624CF00|nr:pyridoxamine 5'-phosphate oxidase family protein [uncultured Gordonia sp.]
MSLSTASPDNPLPDAGALPPIVPTIIDRPRMPDGYGVENATVTLDWATVLDKLTASKHYWLASVRPDGTPPTIPRWGVWLDNRFFYDGAPTTVHARNLEANPACTLTLESGTDVVIVEGTSVAVRALGDGFGQRLAAAFGKYHDLDYKPEPGSWESPTDGGGLRTITPRRAMAWSKFPDDCTRFRFR